MTIEDKLRLFMILENNEEARRNLGIEKSK